MSSFSARRTMMVDTQVRPSDVTKFPIIDAMLSIPREAFVPADRRETAYIGEVLDFGNGGIILDPRSFSKMLDALDIQPNELVLDLGCGLGYSSAVISRLAEAVIAVEEDAAFATLAQSLLVENGSDNVAVLGGDLTVTGAKHGPFDVITIQGGVEQIPQTILDQLKEGGRIAAIFMEGPLGVCRIGRKLNGDISWRYSFNASAPVLVGFTHPPAFAL
mgnify:CR=1 FL=1